MDWLQMKARLRERLPELERQILKLGEFFPLKLLPSGLFRDVACGMDCIAEISRDLKTISPHASDAMLTYWSQRLSQKIHVLVHICRTHTTRNLSVAANLDKLGTRAQWLADLQQKQTRLIAQQTAISKRLETKSDLQTLHALQQELRDIQHQLNNLFSQS